MLRSAAAIHAAGNRYALANTRRFWMTRVCVGFCGVELRAEPVVIRATTAQRVGAAPVDADFVADTSLFRGSHVRVVVALVLDGSSRLETPHGAARLRATIESSHEPRPRPVFLRAASLDHARCARVALRVCCAARVQG